MDVYIDPPDGAPFIVQIGYTQTVGDLKEKVERNTWIPVSEQVLRHNGEVLDDDDNIVMDCGIWQNSSIQLQRRVYQPPTGKVLVVVKTPRSPITFNMEVDRGDTIRRAKEMIQERLPSLSADRLTLEFDGRVPELGDSAALHECGVEDDTRIDVFIKPAPPESSSGVGRRDSGKLEVVVQLWNTENAVAVEVQKFEKASVLRRRLESVPVIEGELPEEYIFVHQGEVIDERGTFDWNDVEDRDTIIVFPRGARGAFP